MCRKSKLGLGVMVLLVSLWMVQSIKAEVMMQWFETEWEEIYRRLPEMGEFWYDYMWIPSPAKAPTGLGTKWGNVGYNLYDRFDIGQIPQRGSYATRYGDVGELKKMVRAAHQVDLKIIPDVLMNHSGNGPDFRYYPGMKPEDFHVQYEEGHANTLNYKRGYRMDQWSPNGGYGGTLWQELVSLIDIRTEDSPRNGDPKRFTGGNNTPGWNLVDGTSFLRHRGQYEKYPYYPGGYESENAAKYLDRWIVWLGNEIDFDGMRLDAAKHVDYEFFGMPGNGWLNEAQYNFDSRHGRDGSDDVKDTLFKNYVARDDLLIFAEILSYQSELNYWYGDLSLGTAGNTRNPMRFIDYPLKQKLFDAFSNGNMGGLAAGGGGIAPEQGVTYAWGHDEAGPGKINLAYAYILSHVGLPMVYFTGNNITWDDNNVRTWMRPGYDSQALADQYGDVQNMIFVHQNFARGNEYDRWGENDFFAYERYDDGVVSANGSPDEGEGLLLAVLNDSGGDQTRNNITVSFPIGTVLKDYTGRGSDVTVYDNGGTPQVNVTVPGNSGQGWAYYAPKVAEAGNVIVKDNGSVAGTMEWIVPGGIHSADKSTQVPRLTSTNITVDVNFRPDGGTVDSAMLKWGQGMQLAGNFFSTDSSLVTHGFESMNQVNSTNWSLSFQIDGGNIPEGLNVIKTRVFNQGTGVPARYNTFTKVVYVDTRGPDLNLTIGEGESVRGDVILGIENPDFTAYGITVAVDGAGSQTAYEVIKGSWKYNLTGLSAGVHTVEVVATEADWDSPRNVINSTTLERTFNVLANTQSATFNHGEGDEIELPFFKTSADVPGSPSSVKLFWNGYELPWNGGMYTNIFNGEVIFRDDSGVETTRLWGAFVNGPSFFEVERVDSGVTNRITRRINLNLYGINAIDSDGDALPDNLEMPFIDSDGAPGADAPWPGDSNKDFVPNYGESWSKLNPYNHSTYYSGQWDDQNDFDGDGYSNYDELMGGYLEGNIYKYNIYDSNSQPTGGSPIVSSSAHWSPSPAVKGQPLTVTYSPSDGPLNGASPVVMHVGHSGKTEPAWLDVYQTNMAASSTNWVVTIDVPTNATSVDFVFRDVAGTTWDNNNGNDWQANVQGVTNFNFNIDGAIDSTNYLVYGSDMYIWAAVNGTRLYVATWAVNEQPGGNDHFIFVTDELGDASDPIPGWLKQGSVYFDSSSKPILASEGESDWESWINVTGSAENDPGAGNRLEGEIDLIDAFGYVPDAVYVAATAYGTYNDNGLLSQGPGKWEHNGSIEVMEFQRVPIETVRDEDLDGHWDKGAPKMWTVVNNATNDANYGLRRFFVNELAGDEESVTVILEPNVGSGNTVSSVELFSNLNRRDFAVLPGDEDWNLITTATQTGYYRAYAMTDIGGGRYSVTLPVNRTGAYRINARYKVNGGSYVYYTDSGLRRDTAVVVSPKKARESTIYELNPLYAEAIDDTFTGRSTFEDMYIVNGDRPDVINSSYFNNLGMNMLWLQPIHPIGADNREIDDSTGSPYDPGSPYAVQNYWKVNSILGDPSSATNAMQEFSDFVQAMDSSDVGIMLDGTFNHSAWDCEIGQVGVDMFAWATNASDLIRAVRPEWYSKSGKYDEHASYYISGGNNDIAVAPDRIDFGKWSDAADFHWGVYDALVAEAPLDTNNATGSKWYHRYLFEEDRLEPLDSYTRELWQYFASYPTYWLENSGHPQGTPKSQSYKGIDGLRCDFAQGLPSAFWEYTINKTRSTKWDFLFMAESLDGFREINGSKRHGIGYRSSRHFDILNENLVFFWRDNFFNYFDYANATSTTASIWQRIDDRRNAFDLSPLLLNLTSHDEIMPHDAQWRVAYAYATLSGFDGAPMLFNGQEAGMQNNAAYYTGRGIDPGNNFGRYELNFEKSIPHFKRYNHMTNVWNNLDAWAGELNSFYQRIGNARLGSPALQSPGNYFLAGTNGWNPDMIGYAKFEAAGVSAASQDVVFVFVNNNYESSADRIDTYNLDVDLPSGANWFGLQSGHDYNIVDLLSTNPTQEVWGADKSYTELTTDGLTVILNQNTFEGKQAQYLKLVDKTDTTGATLADWDTDNDDLPDWWEDMYGISSDSNTGIHGKYGDFDGDGISNYDELLAGTNPNDINDFLEMVMIQENGSSAGVMWKAVEDKNYRLQAAGTLMGNGAQWQNIGPLRTAFSTTESATGMAVSETTQVYRVILKP